MTTDASLPRRFGSYVLTARLAKDALGTVFRALRVSGDRMFVRLRVLETEELSEDAVLDAIEESGEIHGFLKNPAIARYVAMDSVGGVPFIAWNEESGRTLDALVARTRSTGKRVPIEHALLIAEKVATALDHAYNTTVDGERTLHGLVWPGFVSIGDDGETRLTGFGLASGVLPSLGRPILAAAIGPYLAPEERGSGQVGKNADVYSVGAILFELLTGRLPSRKDPLGDLRAAAAARDAAAPIAPELAAILRMCLSPTESRYQSSGELRRELGKLLFSGPYAPSTFNLALYLSGLFGAEIEAENRGRSEEASLDAGSIPELSLAPAPPRRAPAPAAAVSRAAAPPPMARKPQGKPGGPGTIPVAIGILLALAVAGGVLLLVRRASPAPAPAVSTPRPSLPPQPKPTAQPPINSTNAMSEAQFKEEVARRLELEMKRLERRDKARAARAAAAQSAATPGPTSPAAPPRAEPTPAQHSASAPERTEIPLRAAVASPAPAEESIETPPRIASVVKPIYPPSAQRARIRGFVVLRVLVGETGTPLDFQVVQGVGGGLTEAAVTAARQWTFTPARKNGVAVRAWTTVSIPFEP
ncbi:MAG: TonB family protein [Thermoanaerobaculia bacterium]